MIELERHIEILLLSNDCVIVPNLGGFMAHHVDARYDERDYTFLPPLRTLGFNPKLRLNDSLLALSYVDAYDISYPDALARIDDEVAELKQHLENEGSYELADIGTLYNNGEGTYTFEPCEAGILTPQLYGFGSFEMKPIEQEAQKEEETAAPTVIDINATTAEGPKTATANSVFDRNDDSEDKTISIRVSLLRNMAAACIAVVVFFLFSTPLGTPEAGTQLVRSKIDTGLLYRIMPKDLTTKAPTKLVAQPKTDKETGHAAKNDVAQEKAEVPETYYSIVLASHVTRTNARAYVERLHRAGHTPARVLDGKGCVKVVYGTYPTESKAYNALNILSRKPEFAESWVLHVKGSR